MLAGVLVVLVSVPGPDEAAAQSAPPLDLRQLEQDMAAAINRARTNPTGMADILASLTDNGSSPTANSIKVDMADGSIVFTRNNYLDQSISEARLQPVLPALAWSEDLAKLSRTWAPSAANGAGHGNYIARANALGVQGGIEAIGGTQYSADGLVYIFWISSSDKWNLSSPFLPNRDFSMASPSWRGHRGIINDNRTTAIGVGCAQTNPIWDKPSATCVLNAGINMPDESPATTSDPETPPSLDAIQDPFDGSVGTTTLPGQSTLTVDPTQPPPPNTTQTDTDVDPFAENVVGAVDPAEQVTSPGDTPTTTVNGVPEATFEAGCEGFGAFLRQELGSREATRSSGQGCSFDSPDLQEAVLEIAPRSSFPESDVACEDVAQGRADDPQSAAAIHLRSQSSDNTLTAMTSSGSTERSFPFLVSSETGSVASYTLSCDDEFVYRARLRRDAGVNPLLTVNAAAEAMRRSDPASGGDPSTAEEPTTQQPLVSRLDSVPTFPLPSGGRATWTITVSNDSDVAAPITNADLLFLDEGFAYVPGSSNGFTTAEPLVDGSLLRWAQAGLVVPANGELSITFDVTLPPEPAEYLVSGGFKDAGGCCDLVWRITTESAGQGANTAGAGNTAPETTDGGSPEVGKMYVFSGQYFLLESAGTIRECPEGDGSRSGVQDADLKRPQDARSEGVALRNEPCDIDDSGTVMVVPGTVGSVYADRLGPGEFRYVKLTGVTGSGPSARVSFDVCNGGSGTFGIMAVMEVERAEAAGREPTNEPCAAG